MPKFEDFRSDSQVSDMMEQFVNHFPRVFEGFDVGGIKFIVTTKKKSKQPIKLRTLSYPVEVFAGAPYLVEIFEESWNKLDQKRRNLTVFHIMCAFPDGAFDQASKFYGKKVKPQIVMYDMEYAVSGGVPNWMENELAEDPMEVTPAAVSVRMNAAEFDDDNPLPVVSSIKNPVTAANIAEAFA